MRRIILTIVLVISLLGIVAAPAFADPPCPAPATGEGCRPTDPGHFHINPS